ncbi:unnamed protein product [Rhizophagus irregularis]|nr:unnamed protein product [Rhizophagus irregularis]
MALTISKERTIWPRLLGDFKGTDHLAMAPRRFQRWVGLGSIVFSNLAISKERTIWPWLLGDFKGTDYLATAPRRFQRNGFFSHRF